MIVLRILFRARLFLIFFPNRHDSNQCCSVARRDRRRRIDHDHDCDNVDDDHRHRSDTGQCARSIVVFSLFFIEKIRFSESKTRPIADSARRNEPVCPSMSSDRFNCVCVRMRRRAERRRAVLRRAKNKQSSMDDTKRAELIATTTQVKRCFVFVLWRYDSKKRLLFLFEDATPNQTIS